MYSISSVILAFCYNTLQSYLEVLLHAANQASHFILLFIKKHMNMNQYFQEFLPKEFGA
jgi:hypothetical protein